MAPMRVILLALAAAAIALDHVAATSYTGNNVHPRFANVLTDTGLPPVTRMGNRFQGRLLSDASWKNGTFPAGQELRLMIHTAYLANVTDTTRTARRDRVLPYDGLHAPYGGRLTALLRLKNFTLLPAYNVSGPSPVQVRVITAFASRDVRNDYNRDVPVPCDQGHRHDVWADAWATAPRNLAFGRFMVFSSYTTFTAPPFHFRACVRDTTTRNNTADGTIEYSANTKWTEIGRMEGRYWRARKPMYIWRTAATTNDAGDYGAIEIVPLWEDRKPLLRANTFNASEFSLADNIKLVPTGFPCTYEKSTARVDEEITTDKSRSDQYCGSNYVHPLTGEWMQTSTCGAEGSVAGGVATVGSREQNPLATTNPPSDYKKRAEDLPTLVGFLQFPAAGDYDVCVSTRAYRRSRYNNSVDSFNDSPFSNYTAIYPRDAKPVWFKAYAASSSLCAGLTPSSGHSATCYPKRTILTITNGTSAGTTWATTDETPATWGEIAFTATSGTLNYSAATAWDHSNPREYYELAGGDMFRLVPAHHFTGPAAAATGDITRSVSVVTSRTSHTVTRTATNAFTVAYTSASTDLTTTGEGKTVQYALGTPPVGTRSTDAACWWAGDDNYGATGHFGNPGTQCCTLSSGACAENNWCAMTEAGFRGPSASADLGGAPRVDYSPWNADGAGTNAYGFVRMPPGGEFRVCYRRAGGNWKVLQGTHSFRTTANNTFTVRAADAGFTYHFNDSRADTWGPLAITSLSGNTLDKQAWNYYTASSAAAVGSAVKIVTTTESCLTSTAQARTFSADPGSLERNGTAGSADDDTTPTSTVYFYVKVPPFSTSTRYRICFRRGDKNWHALSDPNYAAHDFMTSATDFGPSYAPSMKFTLPAPAEPGMWGQFLFNRSARATPALNLAGDMVRLVPNVSSTGRLVGCDIVYSTTSTDPTVLARVYSADTVTTRIGIGCAATTSTTTDDCYSGTTAPTANGINGQYPYTTINMGSDKAGLPPADEAAVYMKIPAQMPQGRIVGYRVCYKHARFANWVEAEWDGHGSLLTVTRARTLSFSVAGTRYSGQYSYVTIAASAAAPVQWSTDLVKLVDFSETCDATVAAAAGYTTYGAISGVSATHALVDGTNSSTVLLSQGTAGTTTVARAYLTFPTVASRSGADVQYRVCYMARTSTTSTEHNWHDLSGTATPLTVTNQAIAYTALNAPRIYGTFGLRFISGGQSLDTRKGRDAAKLVSSSSLCIGHNTTDYPWAALTGIDHQGLEPDATAEGVTDLPGSDAFPARVATLNVVVNSTGYKVCYRVAGADWIEVLQVPTTERVYALSATDSVIATSATQVSKFTVNSALAAQTGATDTYYGTAWNTLAVGGASTFQSGNAYMVMTYSSARTGSSDVLKLVRTHRETTPGVFVAIPGRTCFSPGVNYTFATTSGSTTVDWKLNLPTIAGRYLVCVWVSSVATWFQVPADTTGNFEQPLSVIGAQQAFAVTSASTLRVFDYYDAGNGTNVGALSGADLVYFINTSAASPGVCGDDLSWEGQTISEAAVYINNTAHGVDTTSLLAIRDATVVLPTRAEAFMVCLKRVQATASNTSGATPFVTTGWYQLRNDGSAYGAGSDVLTNVAATQLNISGCPVYNTTYRLRTGTTFDVTVTAQDADANFIPYAVGTKRYGVALTGSGYALQNYGGDCAAPDAPSFGYTSGALTQFMEDGRVRFSITALGSCPSGGCTVGFTSTNGLSAAPSCTFDVLPTTLKTVRIVSLDSACALGDWCPVRIIAVHADDGVAYTVNSAVSIIASGLGGLSVSGRVKATGASFTVGSGGSANFVNGVLDAELRFSASSYASLTPSTTVSFTATANGATSAAMTTTVAAPIVSEVHVVDLYAVDATGTPVRALQPSWEPAYTSTGARVFRGGDVLSAAAVTAGPGYHLVAGQYYAAVLRVAGAPATGSLRYLDQSALMDTSISVSMSSPSAVLAGTACSSSAPTCTTGVPSQNLAPTMTFTFRVNPASTCTSGVCDIQFLFNGGAVKLGAPTTRIYTPVRTVATKLQFRCATSLSALSTAVAGVACPTTTVNQGWFVNVTAVDDNGNVDRFFDGDVLAVFSSSAKPTSNAKITTVAALKAGTVTPGYAMAQAAAGSALFSGLTFTRPCTGTGCKVQLLSTWGVGVLELGSLQATPNTHRLACTLDTAMPYCTTDADGNCAGIAGISAANVSNAESLLYKDTTMCVNVNAVDINGNPTLYETNWVLYYAEDTASSGKQALTIRDENANTDFVSRYKAMQRSGVRFCFTVSGTFTTSVSFKVNFAAQRFNDANYWSQGTTGTCSVGALKLWAKKKAASVGVTAATGLEVIRSGRAAVVAAEKTGTSSLAAALEFSVFDHYGTVVPAADLATADQAYRVRLGTNNGAVDIVRAGSVPLRGAFNMTAAATTSSLASTVAFTVSISDFCLGCSIGFTLVDSTSASVALKTLATPNNANIVTANVSFFIVNTRAAATRALAFHPGTSPFGGNWINDTAVNGVNNTGPTTHLATCAGTACKPAPETFNLAKCDSRGTTYIGASATTPLQMRVMTLDPGYALSALSEPDDTSRSHVDILNTYTVAATFGTQIMECVTLWGGKACVDDKTTAPKQVVAAYGATVRAAVTAFANVSDSAIRATSFMLVGLSASSYLAINASTATLAGSDLPDVGGAFNATASSSTTSAAVASISLEAGNEFFWRPVAEPQTIVIRDVALDADPCAPANASYACYGGVGCTTVGLVERGTVSDGLAFNYSAQRISTGVAFPVTVEVLDEGSLRVFGASGTVSIAVDSWTGCNNGGEASFSGTVTNGRATVWLTFTTPCQDCVLKATYTPSSSQTAQHSAMLAKPAGRRAFSKPVSVTSDVPVADHVVATASTPATILQGNATTMGTVGTAFSVAFAERGVVGRIPVVRSGVTATIRLALEAQTTARNWWLVGNGGVLRPTLTANQHRHHQVVSTGAAALSFYFTRTCHHCRVHCIYKLPTKAAVAFRLPSVFVITTTATQRLLVGFQPSHVEVFRDTSFSVWATGSDASDITHAGTAAPAGGTANPSFSVTTAGNGDGGTMSSSWWSFNATAAHRVTFTLPCTRCTVGVSGVTLPIKVFTQPTFLQPIIAPQGGVQEPVSSVSVGSQQTVEVRALDDSGYVGEMYGASGTAFPGRAFAPLCCAKPVTFAVSHDGRTNGGFPRTEATFIMADTAALSGSGSVSRGVGTMSFNFTQPVRDAYVLFDTADITSRTTSRRPRFPQPRFSISVGTSGLTLRAVSNTDVTRLTSTQPFAVDVALTGTVGGDSTRSYVATAADNNITVAFSNCPAVDPSTPTVFFLNAGYARVNLTFAAGDASGNCRITFTANAGSASCSGSACSASLSSVSVKELVPTSFRFLRPGVLDNGRNSTAGVMFGAAGRQTKVTVQLFGADAFGNQVPVRTCATCRLEVRMEGTATGQFASCALNTEAPAAFDANGTATVAVLYQDNAQPTYLCNLKVAVFSDVARTTPLLAPDLTSQFHTSVVTICRPAKVAILTNTSTVFRGVVLRTGVAYDLYAVIQDANGNTCFGDSQDEATRLTVEAVSNDANLLLSRDIRVVNVNDSDATTAGFLNGWRSAAPARTEVRAVNGGFNFRVVFSNSTMALGLNGIRLRVTARSATPAISGTAARAYSSPLDTIIAASKLRFAPSAAIPPNVVTGRTIQTGLAGRYSTDVVVQAVDGLDPAWVSLGLLTAAPNIARAPTAFGNAEEVFWKVLPAPASGAFPIGFTTGQQLTRLRAGESRWSGLTWNGPNGIYTWSVATTSGALAETSPVSVACQQVDSLRLDTATYGRGAAATCRTGCPLPASVFPVVTNATVNSGTPTFAAQSLQSFTMTVSLRDSNGAVVLGDSESVVMVELLSDSRTSVQLGIPPSMTTRGALYARVQGGRATFTLAFAGSTALGGNADANATFRFSCPATRPAATLLAGEPAANPCAGMNEATTLGFAVVDIRLPASAHTSASALAVRQVIKFQSALTSHELFNQTHFRGAMVPLLAAAGFGYITPANVGRVLALLPCTVTSAFAADLGTSVCEGTPRRCSAGAENLNCPSQVLSCACPVQARSLLLTRFLLQSGNSTGPIVGGKIAVEMSFNLANADAFPARNATELANAYRLLGEAATAALRDPSLAEFVIDASSISTRALNAVAQTEAPAVTPSPPTTAAPTAAPQTTATPEVSFAPSVQLSISMLFALLLAVASLL